MHVAVALVLGVFALGTSGWSALALHYAAPGPARSRGALAALVLLAPAAAGLAFRQHAFGAASAAAAAIFGCALAWFLSLRPRQRDNWRADVDRTARAELCGSLLTVHNVRNFHYVSETDYTPRWETRRYDLSKLAGLDMFFSYWGHRAIAHTILSWAFDGGEHLAISVEARYRIGQQYSAIGGFFRRFPICYVVADERDVIRLRTNYRGENVWLYRVRAPAEGPRLLLLDYVESINRLAQTPAWYNALTDNCTTTIRTHVRRLSPGSHPWHWRLLANGYLPALLYDQGRLDRSLPFDELRALSNIDERAKAASYADFSHAIRTGLPLTTASNDDAEEVGSDSGV